MRILIDICHPAHVHLFRNFYNEMKREGHDLLVTVKEIPVARELMKIYGIPFMSIGSKSDMIISKAFNQLSYDKRMFSIVRSNKIEIGIGSSITIAHVSRILKMKSIIFDEDDDHVQPLMKWFGHTFADFVVSPNALRGSRRRKNTIFYQGYHELAYLHPGRFEPDPNVLKEAGIESGETFYIMRFNTFKAHHDVGAKGFSASQKRELIRYLNHRGKIFITSERDIEPEFERYRLKISPHKIHSLLYFSTLFIGDSQTMTSEAAILGTPAVKLNSFAGRLSVPNELESKYNLCISFPPDDFQGFLNKINELLGLSNLKEEWQCRRLKMLADKIDVTKFMKDLVLEIYNNKEKKIISVPFLFKN